MRPRISLKAPSILLPSHNSLGVSRRMDLWATCGYRLTSTLSPTPAAAKHSSIGLASRRQSKPRITTRGAKPLSVITTLDPSRLDSASFMDISNMDVPGVYHPTLDGNVLLLKLRYVWKQRSLVPFPSGTHGFLYLYTDPLDPLEPDLRFRVTENDNPKSFARGTDLEYGPGLPFHVNLPRILLSPSKEELRKFLIQDGLIDEARMKELLQKSAYGRPKRRPKWPITGLNEPFTYDLSGRSYTLMVCRGSERAQYPMHSPLRFQHRLRTFPLFEKGLLECRFERSTFPEHRGRRVVLMRLLRILEPPVPISNPPRGADMTVPAEGELFTVHDRLWQRDVDRPSGHSPGLQLLFDPDDTQMSK